jgi:transcription termination factor NusB
MALSFKEKNDIRKQISAYLVNLEAGDLPFKEKNTIRKSVAELLARLNEVIDLVPEIQNEKLQALIDGKYNDEPPEFFLRMLKEIIDEIKDIEPVKPPTIAYVKLNVSKSHMVLENARQLGLSDIVDSLEARMLSW